LSFEAIERSASQLKRIADLRWNPGVRRTSLILFWDDTSTKTSRTSQHCIRHYSSDACADARDKVYGLLGLVKQDEQVAVDYSKSVLAVFLDAVEILARTYFQQPRLGRKPVHYVTIARLLARNMGLLPSSKHELGAADESPLLLFLDEIPEKQPDAEWYQRVLNRLGP